MTDAAIVRGKKLEKETRGPHSVEMLSRQISNIILLSEIVILWFCFLLKH